MDSGRTNNAATTADQPDSSSNTPDSSMMNQALRLYEQQLALLSNMSQASPATAAMFPYNPYLLGSMAGLTGYAGLPGAAAAVPGLAEYQAALAAAMTSQFPPAALYSSAMGYPSMPFPQADYTGALSALSSSLLGGNTSAVPNLHSNSAVTSAEPSRNSPALSHSSRSSIAASATASTHIGQRNPTPSKLTSNHATTRLRERSVSPASSKRARLTPSKVCEKDRGASGDSASFFKGMTADEFDINTHFKNSLGNLYQSNGIQQKLSSLSSSHARSGTHSEKIESNSTTDGSQNLGLDLSIKSSSSVASSIRLSAPSPSTSTTSLKATSANLARKSVIKTPCTNSRLQSNVSSELPTRCSTQEKQSTHSSSISPSRVLPSTDSPFQVMPTQSAAVHNTETLLPARSYEALPNLKRLAGQLKTEKTADSTAISGTTSDKSFVSLLKPNNTPKASTEDTQVKKKVRTGKQSMLEDEKNEIRMKLQRENKSHRISHKPNRRVGKRQLQAAREAGPKASSNESLKRRNRRKSNQQPRPSNEGDVVFPNAAPVTAEQPRLKRPYIRTKLAKEKPVDMVKLAVPFEYGWRRETRIRGISKNGRMIGEVFYYTPNDKRMRSFNDVLKYLAQLRARNEQAAAQGDDDKSTHDTVSDGEGVSQPPAECDTELQVSSDTSDKVPSSSVNTAQNDITPATHCDISDKVSSSVNTAQNDITPATHCDNSDKVPSSAETPVHNGVASETTAGTTHTAGNSAKEGLSMKGRPAQWLVLSKEHFSFSTKVKLGDFLEQKPGEKYILLNDEERDKRIQLADEKRCKQIEKLNKVKAKKIGLKETEQPQTEKERKQSELTRKSLQMKLKKQLEREKVKTEQDMMKRQRALTIILKKKQQQEERDRDRQEKQEKARYMLEMRERQRQCLINTKIMETKRREEERKRHQIEKIVQKERRLEIKKRQIELSRELKQPVEDLRLPNVKCLPELNRIPGMKLSGSVFADVLQCHQFLTNFHECLELKQSVPTLNTFQQALIGSSKHSRHAVNKILSHMLNFALRDPGVRNPTKFSNEIGQKLNNLIVDEWNFSEILRVFILERDTTPSQLTRELEQKPFDCLCAEMKSKAMVWLCDELNTSKTVTEEIDNNMESVLNLRRDKWELEGKLRELKSSCGDIHKHPGKSKDPDNSDQSDNEEESAADQLSNAEGSKLQSNAGVDKKMDSADEKKLEKLTKQYAKCCKDVVTKCGTVRTFPYGMDRYRRYYWSLPSFRGVLVESHESSVHSTASAATDRKLNMQQPSESEKEEKVEDSRVPQTAAVCKVEHIETGELKLDDVKCEIKPVVPASDMPEVKVTDSAISLNESPKTAVPVKLNGMKSASHSIASWLSSTIDNIFTKEGGEEGTHTSSHSPLTSSQSTSQYNNSSTSLTSSPPIVVPVLPATNHVTTLPPQLYTQTDNVDAWFELARKLPCDKLEKFSPQLVSNSLAFMNCVTGSEEQKELEALERLAAKAAILDSDRVVPTNVQKGWWIMKDYEQVKAVNSSLHPRAIRERHLSRSFAKHREKIERLFTDQGTSTDVELDSDARDLEIAKSSYQAPLADDNSSWTEKQCRVAELAVLDKVEDLEERVFQASIYTKTWADQKKHDATDLELIVTPIQEIKDGEKRILDLVKEKLLLLEAGVERRYLKPPFVKNNAFQLVDIVTSNSAQNGTEAELSDDSEDSKSSDDNCSKGLLQWKQAVRGAVNLSQLYISLEQLENCIAWEKSVMRVLCQVCRSDDNEDQLLLCDNCDKGYHTYCFKPKMTSIPSGDWYCWECRSKATSVAHCIRCGKSTGKMAQCHKCPQAIHLDCSLPALHRVPRRHTCGHCQQTCNRKSAGKQKRLSKQKTYESSDEEELADDVASDAGEEDTDEKVDDVERDVAICREVMADIEKHKDAEPFMEPVDTKAFPQYKKYIKHPMDLGKISNKLINNRYETRTEFYDDMILIFDNCLLFNEDNSEVGKSGKILRRHFLKRWKQLCAI